MTPPLVVVDIGNSRVQMGLVSGLTPVGRPEWGRLENFPTSDWSPAALANWLPSQPVAWRVASVHRPTEQRLAQWRAEARPLDHYHLLRVGDLPLKVDVEQPERVGMDRLVAAVAANRLRRADQAAIVVDAGTAVTVDVVSSDGVFRGGAILPGLRMMTRALATDTDLLPMVHVAFADDPPPVLGKSTEGAIRSGAFWGAVGAIRQIISRLPLELGRNAQLFVTGGDARILARLIDPLANFVPDMVLAGVVWSRP